jgi:hypothetical protein
VVRSFSGDENGAYTLRVVEGAVSDEWDDDGDDGDGEDDDDEDYDDEDYDEEDYDHDVDVDVDVDMDVDVDVDVDEDMDVDADEYDSDVMMVDTVLITEDFSGMGWTIVPIEAGETVEGTLDDDDPRTGEGHLYQDFAYQADEGEQLTIRAASGDVDPYVFIGAAGGEDLFALGEDDDGGPGTDSELTFTVPEAGEYVIRVAAAMPDQTGAFTLEVRSTR